MAVALDQNLFVLQQYGPVQPTTLQGPVRQGLGKYGDGLFVEEGTTNLITNPGFEVDATGVSTQGTTPSFAASSARAAFGTKSLLITWPAATAFGSAAIQTVTFTATGTYTFSLYVYVPTGSSPVTGQSGGGTATLTVTTASANSFANNQWQRLFFVVNVTAVGNWSFGVINVNATTAGQQVYTDGWQLEQKAYATSYCDGSLSTTWNATGNLLPTAAQSFEDGTTASASVVGGTATLANSGAQFYAGTKSLLVTATSTAVLGVAGGATGTGAAPVTAGRIHTGSQWVRPSAARQLRVDVYWYTAAGTFISGSAGTAVTGVANTWTRQSSTFVAPATAAFALPVLVSTDATNGDTFYIDAQRISEGTDAGSYRWTGAENASTSTRTAGALNLAMTTTPPLTVAAWLRVGTLPTASLSRPIARLSGSGTAPDLVLANGIAQFSTLVDVAANLSVSPLAGDLVFVAGAIAADGKTFTVFASFGGAISTSTSAASATAFTAPTTITIGTDLNGTNYADGVIEQVLVYNRALTLAEVTALSASSSEVNFASDPGIVLAAGTGVVRGTPAAETAAGTGYYRSLRKLAAYFETITPTGSSPDDDAATMKVTVPAGSGVGVGDVVGLNYPTAPYAKTVLRVFSPGGDYDELYL